MRDRGFVAEVGAAVECGKSNGSVRDVTEVVTGIEMAQHSVGISESLGEDQVL